MAFVGDRVGPLMHDRSVQVLVIANVAALVAAIVFSWDVFQLILLYWVETAIIGVFSIVKMLHRGKLLAIPLIAFFCVHFGIFMFVHLMFIIVFFSGMEESTIFGMEFILGTLLNDSTLLAIPAVVLFGSHLFSFFYNYFGKGEYQKKNLMHFFIYPYPRVIVMHLTILFGGMLVLVFGPIFGLIFLSVLKIITDVGSHTFMHRRQ